MDDQAKQIYRFGLFELNESKRRLQDFRGKSIPLRRKVFDVLLLLVKNHGYLVSKEKLLANVWGDLKDPEEGVISQCITTLRKVLGDNHGKRKYIQTVWGIGFKFIKPVIVSYEETGLARLGTQSGDVEGKLNDSNVDILQTENSERIRKLFFPRSDAMELFPADDHPLKDIPQGHTNYPNQERAMQAIRSLLGEETQMVEEKYPSDPAKTLVCIGSSVAHRESRRIMGDPLKGGRFKHAESDCIIEFPYTIVSRDAYVKRLQDGRERITRHCGVIDLSDNIIVPEHYKSRLAGDILLVTRLPRILGGPDILIFAGAHGPAIRAVELLLHRMDTRDLEYLEKCVEGSQYFQAVFHIPALREEGDTTVPVEIRCDRSEDFRPRPVKVRYRRN